MDIAGVAGVGLSAQPALLQTVLHRVGIPWLDAKGDVVDADIPRPRLAERVITEQRVTLFAGGWLAEAQPTVGTRHHEIAD
jgi:hypothetical protein